MLMSKPPCRAGALLTTCLLLVPVLMTSTSTDGRAFEGASARIGYAGREAIAASQGESAVCRILRGWDGSDSSCPSIPTLEILRNDGKENLMSPERSVFC